MTDDRRILNSLLALFSLLVASGCASKSEPTAEKSEPAAEKAASQRRDAILEEINGLGEHEWAGEYYSGDGLGVNISLAIAPRSGYVFAWHGCLGLYDRNYGAVSSSSDGQIHLSFTFENERGGFRGIAPDFVPVSWGPRRYLVPADEIVGFCSNINEGREPRMGRHGFYLLRRGDETKEVVGLPTVPAKYRSYLLDKPIEARITAVGAFTTRPSRSDWKFKDTPVTLDAGSNRGLRSGMELVVTEPEHIVQSVRITKVEADRAEGIVTQIGEDEDGPVRGWRVSTKAPWHK